MDFADIDRTERDAEGTWLHLKKDGKYLYWDAEANEGKGSLVESVELVPHPAPCRVKVWGATKPEILSIHRKVEAVNKALAVRIGKADDSEYEDLLEKHDERLRSFDDELALATVGDMENIYFRGEKVSPTPDMVKAFFGGGSPFINQIAVHTARDMGFSIPAVES